MQLIYHQLTSSSGRISKDPALYLTSPWTVSPELVFKCWYPHCSKRCKLFRALDFNMILCSYQEHWTPTITRLLYNLWNSCWNLIAEVSSIWEYFSFKRRNNIQFIINIISINILFFQVKLFNNAIVWKMFL